MSSALRSASIMHQKTLRGSAIPARVKNTKYAVRGEIVQKATKIQEDIANGKKMPFKRVIYCNIGNPQELGQKPITFFRQVSAMVEYPELTKHTSIFPDDAIKRAETYLKHIKSSGSYSHSQGVSIIRTEVANFIRQRDGQAENDAYTSESDIFLTAGASPAVQQSVVMLIENENDGIMIPIPQYPLYSATIPLFGGKTVPYYLDFNNDWGMNVDDLKNSLTAAKKDGINTKAIVIINPGNPTGQCLDPKNMEEIIKFCYDNEIVILADEVYQENIYTERKWHSFKKILWTMDPKYRETVQILSYHSVSKGIIGECGKRGGYVEMTNVEQDVKDAFYKLSSIKLCPNVPGQLVVGMMVNPPKPGETSYKLYNEESTSIFKSLKARSVLVTEALNKLEGIQCNVAQGAMYIFARISLPPKAIEAAKKAGKTPDAFYCLALLEEAGLCVVPGSGFGQKEGTFHFRTTFLPLEHHLEEVLDHLKTFHESFYKKYA